MKVLLAALFCLALAAAAHGAPLLFHAHGHGLAFSPDGAVLLAPSREGLAAYEDGAWWEVPGPAQGFSGFSVAERAIYSSGHTHGEAANEVPTGLMRSIDGGRTWRAVALAGTADFQLLAAGYRSGAIYVLNPRPSPLLPAAGLYVTRDEGRTWRAAAARGLAGEIHALAAHPQDARVVAVGTATGLYLSRDDGETFARLDRSEPVTAVAFDHHGARLFYARALSNDVIDRVLEGGGERRMRLPRLAGDYITCLAHSPTDESVLAFATRKRDVYLTRNAGATWRRLARNGTAGANAEDRNPSTTQEDR